MHTTAEGRCATFCASSSAAEQPEPSAQRCEPRGAPGLGLGSRREAVRCCPRTAVPLRQRISHNALPRDRQDSFANVFTWGRNLFTFTDVRASVRRATPPRRAASLQGSEQSCHARIPPRGRPPPGAERPAPLPSERPAAPHLPSGSAANGGAGVGLTRCAAASSGGGRALRERRRVGGSVEASGAEAARLPATLPADGRGSRSARCARCAAVPSGLRGASCAERSARLERCARRNPSALLLRPSGSSPAAGMPYFRGDAFRRPFLASFCLRSEAGRAALGQRELCRAGEPPSSSPLYTADPQLSSDEGPHVTPSWPSPDGTL